MNTTVLPVSTSDQVSDRSRLLCRYAELYARTFKDTYAVDEMCDILLKLDMPASHALDLGNALWAEGNDQGGA